MPQSRTLYGGTLGASNPTFTTRVTFDPTKQRPFVCVSVPATAPDVQGSIYDDISQSFSAIDYASTDLFPDDYTGPGGVAMKMGCVLQQLQLRVLGDALGDARYGRRAGAPIFRTKRSLSTSGRPASVLTWGHPSVSRLPPIFQSPCS